MEGYETTIMKTLKEPKNYIKKASFEEKKLLRVLK